MMSFTLLLLTFGLLVCCNGQTESTPTSPCSTFITYVTDKGGLHGLLTVPNKNSGYYDLEVNVTFPVQVKEGVSYDLQLKPLHIFKSRS